MKKRKKKAGGVLAMNASKWRFAAFVALPTFLLYFYICIVPMISSIANSVYDWNGYGPKIFIGMQNYVNIFKDAQFWEAFKNDILIVFFKEIIIVFLAVLFAVSLTKARLCKSEVKFYRFLYYIPKRLKDI